MDDKEINKIKNEIDIKLATEISKATVHEMAKLKETKTNKIFHTITIIIMSIICIVCIIFTGTVGFETVSFLSSIDFVEVVDETCKENINMDAESDNGNATNLYNSNNNNIGGK